jgi:hypothetical protein
VLAEDLSVPPKHGEPACNWGVPSAAGSSNPMNCTPPRRQTGPIETQPKGVESDG